MSELLALSFDVDVSPRIGWGGEVPSGQPAIYGWGIGWYPGSERGASVVKDPTSSGQAGVGAALGDWNRFRSTLFLSHMRGHQRPRSQQDAQPFVRSYGGRQWIFAHDGDLTPGYADPLSLGEDPTLAPLGRTDSEHAFCWILEQIRSTRARSLKGVPPEALHEWFREVNRAGTVNALLSDGQRLAVYRDAGLHGQLLWTRRIPPHASNHLQSEAVVVDLEGAADVNHTSLIFSSSPLSSDSWVPMQPGQLMLARRGAVLWDSQPQTVSFVPGAVNQALDSSGQRSEASQQIAAVQPTLARNSQLDAPPSRLLSVLHETRYQYEEPVERSSHRLLVHPVEDALQRVESFELEITPNELAIPYEDVFGNSAHALELPKAYQELCIRSRTRVRVNHPPLIENRGSHRRETIPLVWMPWQQQMLSAYLLPTELPETQLQELSDFAMSFVERNEYDLVATLQDINDTIYRDFEYVSGSTTIATTPFEVFESRRGVCQDFANLMICMARLLNVPARYRMGYIFTGADYQNKIQSEASHAWLELYIPRVGWHGFDPTNGREVGSEHVRVACGRGYRDATPTSGTIYRGGGTETLTVSVKVEEIG